MTNILSPKEILREEIQKTRKELPFSLKVQDIVKLTNSSENTVYLRLERGEIPGANKIMGHWRVPRDIFLAWWYGIKEVDELTENIID